MTRHLDVGSYNLYQRSDNTRAAHALTTFAQLIDVAGLQEFGGPERRQILQDLDGIDFYKPHEFPTAPPIIWRKDRLELIRGRVTLVARGRRVNKIPGRLGTLPDYYATTVVLRDLSTTAPNSPASELVVTNIHTQAHVEFWPGARREMYREALANTIAELRRDTHPYRAAFVTGDFNWSLKPGALPVQMMGAAGLDVMWANHPANTGTHGRRRVIDGVFSNRRTTATHVITKPRVGDHGAAVGRFRL